MKTTYLVNIKLKMLHFMMYTYGLTVIDKVIDIMKSTFISSI